MRKISTWALLGAALLALCGCATESRSTGSRNNHVVEKRQTVVVVPATAEAPAQIVPVTEITERWEDERTQAESSGKTVPDVAAVVSTAASIGTTAATGGWGNVALGVATALATAAVGYAAKKGGESAQKDERIKFHLKDAAEGWSLADERALALDPKRNSPG